MIKYFLLLDLLKIVKEIKISNKTNKLKDESFNKYENLLKSGSFKSLIFFIKLKKIEFNTNELTHNNNIKLYLILFKIFLEKSKIINILIY